jgi:hypothetical protein
MLTKRDSIGDPEVIVKSEQEWGAWVSRQLKKRENVFTSDPAELVAAHRREIGYTRDYHGREILELLQNADDASGEPDTRSQRAALVLDEAGLCFANTGIPFSEDGVESLMVSNYSPKKGETRYIGNRGLGFRSVLRACADRRVANVSNSGGAAV